MPEDFEQSPLDDEQRGSHADWAGIIRYLARSNFDTPSAPMQSAEFWLDQGGKLRRDIEKIEVAREFYSLGIDQMHAPCNLMSLQIDEAEAFVEVGNMMLRGWQELALARQSDEDEDAEDEDEDAEDELMDDDDDDIGGGLLLGIVHRKKYVGVLDLNIPEQADAYHSLPYALACDADATDLSQMLARKQEWLHETRRDIAAARREGHYRDYGPLIKIFRQSDVERLLAGVKSTQLPYFLRELQGLIDSSAAGTHRKHTEALLARLIAYEGGGGSSPQEQRRTQGGGRRQGGSRGNSDNESEG